MNMMLTAVIGAASLLAPVIGDEEVAALLKKASYPLTEAIQKATALAKEGVLVSAELDEVNGKAVYIVEFAQGSKVVEITLDAATGELQKKLLEDDDKTDLVKACKVSLNKGIAAAVEKVPGKAVAAESDFEDEKPIFEVKIFSDGKLKTVIVDAATGAVLKIKHKKTEGEKKEESKEGEKK